MKNTMKFVTFAIVLTGATLRAGGEETPTATQPTQETPAAALTEQPATTPQKKLVYGSWYNPLNLVIATGLINGYEEEVAPTTAPAPAALTEQPATEDKKDLLQEVQKAVEGTITDALKNTAPVARPASPLDLPALEETN